MVEAQTYPGRLLVGAAGGAGVEAPGGFVVYVVYDADPRVDLDVLVAPCRIVLRGRVVL